jgi:hypothetical protein
LWKIYGETRGLSEHLFSSSKKVWVDQQTGTSTAKNYGCYSTKQAIQYGYFSNIFFFPPVGLVNHGWWIWIKNESGQSNTKICWMGFGPTKRATILGS